MIVTKQRFD